MKKKQERHLILKLFVSAIYLVIITILFVASFRLFKEKKEILPFREIDNVEEYTYIDVSKMSEKFAYFEENNIGIHFVIEKEDTGLWHTYLIAINENEYDKYKNIIDYTYERIKEKPDPIRVYGYPTIADDKLKDLAVKNIVNFVPKENEVKITRENYENYLTNSYLDTTKEQEDDLSILLIISLLLLFIMIALFIITIFDKGHMTDNFDREVKRIKKKLKLE